MTARIFVSWAAFYTEKVAGRYRLHAKPGTYATTGLPIEIDKSTRLMAAEPGSYTLEGQAATLLRSRNLAPQPGTFSVTGFAVPLRGAIATIEVSYASMEVPRSASRVIQPELGTLTYAGQPVGLSRTRLLITAGTSYTSSGRSARTLFNRRLAAERGTFTLSGQDTSLRHARRLPIEAGEYTSTGYDAITTASRVLRTDPQAFTIQGQSTAYLKYKIYYLFPAAATYAITGQDTATKYGRATKADAGSFTTEGFDLSTRYDRAIHTDPAEIVTEGQPLTLRKARRLVAEPEAYTLGGQDVSMRVVVNIVPASRGGFDLIGQPIILRHNRRLVASAGEMALAGMPVGSVQRRVHNTFPICIGP